SMHPTGICQGSEEMRESHDRLEKGRHRPHPDKMRTTRQICRGKESRLAAHYEHSVRGASLGYPKDYATRASNRKAFEGKRKARNRARCCESQNTYLRRKY